MFSIFKKPIRVSTSDKVWKTKTACCKGVATEAMSSLTKGMSPIVFFFFPGDQRRFVEFLDSNQVPRFVVEPGRTAEALQQKGTILIMDAFTIATTNTEFLSRWSKAVKPCVIFFGRYPLITSEDKILENLAGVLSPVPFVFCLSLEDGLLETFDSARIKPLMETLGMTEDQCIEHAMVSMALLKARKKLGEKVQNEMKANTETEWYRINLNTL